MRSEVIEAKLGFGRLRQMLLDACISSLGREHVEHMKPLTGLTKIRHELECVREFQLLRQSKTDFPTEHYYDKRAALHQSSISGASLPETDLYEILLSLRAASACINAIFSTEEEDSQALRSICQDVILHHQLIVKLEGVLDDTGRILDKATPELYEVRTSLISLKQTLRREVDDLLKEAQKEGFSDGESLPTIRNGRMVIPVKSEYKRQIQGLIHDESDSGQTTYLEPNRVFNLNNRIRELEHQERRELIKIRGRLTTLVGEAAPDLFEVYEFLGNLDFIRSKSQLANQLNGMVPEIKEKPGLTLVKARHPLLILSLGYDKTSPIELSLEKEQRFLVISGPNAGGKSVSLKTVGLLQYMVQCGLPVPADTHSVFGIFDDFLIDIGDEQSLDDELSTYSAHLSSMHRFIKRSSPKTLVLIDEFGTGTEPEYGGAMAASVLLRFQQSGTFGVATTHYAVLKDLANELEGLFNGAMLFDAETMSPTYQLQTGRPGNSFALEIAERIGFSSDFLEEVQRRVGKSKIDYDTAIKSLEANVQKQEELLKELEDRKVRMAEAEKEYQELKDFMKLKKNQVIREAKLEAQQLVKGANKRIERAISEIKKSEADKKKTKEARKDIEKLAKEVAPEPKPQPVVKKREVLEGEIAPGDHVQDLSGQFWGEVIAIRGKEAELQVGELRMHKKVKELQRVSKREAKQKKKESRNSQLVLDKRMAMQQVLDIRGNRVEEIMSMLDRFLDDAMLSGVQELKIIHGRGTGVLRQHVRDYLRDTGQVKDIRNEAEEQGGDGATLVTLI